MLAHTLAAPSCVIGTYQGGDEPIHARGTLGSNAISETNRAPRQRKQIIHPRSSLPDFPSIVRNGNKKTDKLLKRSKANSDLGYNRKEWHDLANQIDRVSELSSFSNFIRSSNSSISYSQVPSTSK